MIEAFRALESWLQSQNINPANVQVTISADPMPADRIACALRSQVQQYSLTLTGDAPIREGHICGIKFNVADR